MSITSAKSGATGISLALDNNYMEPIATTVVGAGSASFVEFRDIPLGYKHLQLRAISRSSTAGSTWHHTYMNLGNGAVDIGANYSSHILVGNGSSASAEAYANASQLESIPESGATNTANTYSAMIIDILDYSNTSKYKTLRTLSGGDDNGSGYIFYISGNWRSLEPVTTIKYYPSSSYTIAQYSRFSLYGIRG